LLSDSGWFWATQVTKGFSVRLWLEGLGVDWREVDGKGFGTKLYMEK